MVCLQDQMQKRIIQQGLPADAVVLQKPNMGNVAPLPNMFGAGSPVPNMPMDMMPQLGMPQQMPNVRRIHSFMAFNRSFF